MRYPVTKWLFLALFSGFATLATAQAPNEADNLVKQGVDLYDAGKYDEAVLRYRQAIKLDPQNATAQYELAMTYNALGRNEEAVALCEEILKKGQNDHAGVYITYANALDGLKKPKEAVRVYEQGIRKFPTQGMLYYNLGVTQSGMQLYDEAIASMQQAVRLNPRHASAHLSLSMLTAAQNNRVPALLELVRFLQLEPQSRRSAPNLARLDKLLTQGVEQTGENSTTMNLSTDMLKLVDGKKNKPDNFGQADMLLTMDAALDTEKKNKKKTPTERLAEKLTTLCASLEEQKPATHPGFVWGYYVPYFITLEKAGHMTTLAYVIQSARTGQPEVGEWLAKHEKEVKELQEWSAAYVWSK